MSDNRDEYTATVELTIKRPESTGMGEIHDIEEAVSIAVDGAIGAEGEKMDIHDATVVSVERILKKEDDE